MDNIKDSNTSLPQQIISLNGWWDWTLPGHAGIKKIVPSNYICVGEALFEKTFVLPESTGKCVTLHFEGVHYTGAVKLSGESVGDMLPYVCYDFDISEIARPGENKLEVLIKDLNAHYGPTPGWESYGGITRDVWVEIAPQVGIGDVQWITSMQNHYTAADATVNFLLYNKSGVSKQTHVTATLKYAGATVAEKSTDCIAEAGTSNGTISFTLNNIHPWDTEFPHLYELSVVSDCGGDRHGKRLDVGFREFIAKGPYFYLNGEKTFLKGVARHEMWGDNQGFYLTKEQIEQDLTLIKKMGANFVRLVHYPHSRYTIEYAAKIGLMVSEEPGLWGGALNTEEIANDAMDIMRRTVLRDRSNPAVVAWLFFNEVNMDNPSGRKYIVECARMCRALDPLRLLSGASNMDLESSKRVFDDCGFDFYTQHAYCYDGGFFYEAACRLRGKPLVYTEWGGWLIHHNPNLIAYFKRQIAKLAHAPEHEPCLAGMCWWQWQDIYECMRGLHGCFDNILTDGLVDRFRTRKPSYTMMAEFFDIVDKKPYPLFDVTEYGGGSAAALTPVCLNEHYGELNDALWREARQIGGEKKLPPSSFGREYYQGIYMHCEFKSIAGLRTEIPRGYPIILRGTRKAIEVKVGKKINKVYIFGGVTFWDGYPIRGTLGDEAAKLTLKYSGGMTREIPLRHGYEIASASLLSLWSRLDARAAFAPRVARFVLDYDFEDYAMNLITVDTEADKVLETVSITSTDDAFDPVIYSISVKVLK